jgi:hypothetical protein
MSSPRIAVLEDAKENARPSGYIWKSCCFSMDSRAVLFFVQVLFSLLVMLLCFKLIVDGSDENKQWARLTISFVIGLWMPAPRVNK